eukprot:COSAG02_NODE_2830_length_7936_cov_40.231849_9_plen_268_part_00
MASYSASSALAAPADELAWPSDFRHFRLFSPRPFFCLPRPFRDPPRADPTFGLAGTPARQSQHPCGPTVRVWASPNEGAGINAIAPSSPGCKIVPVQGPECVRACDTPSACSRTARTRARERTPRRRTQCSRTRGNGRACVADWGTVHLRQQCSCRLLRSRWRRARMAPTQLQDVQALVHQAYWRRKSDPDVPGGSNSRHQLQLHACGCHCQCPYVCSNGAVDQHLAHRWLRRQPTFSTVGITCMGLARDCRGVHVTLCYMYKHAQL